MQLTVIIVNYNVKYFLEQCLHSVVLATQQLIAEIIVVDNVSTDGSIAYLQHIFPYVIFIQNKKNIGFGAANNIALQKSKGAFIALVNPDTIIQENTFHTCIQHIQQNQQVGAVGVKMIDGSGKFLPESKRSFPSIQASFFKMTGLSALCKRSAMFNQYALGHLHENNNHPVSVLAGAFMVFSRQVYQQVGGFDEDFFMYGEDIDLSYRIEKAGYTNFYLANTTILHFKGESTQRGSYTYVYQFYKAMQLFVKKHYVNAHQQLLIACIQLAIMLKGISSFIKNYLFKLGMPLVDALVIFTSYTAVEQYWIQNFRNQLPFQQANLPVYTGAFSIVYVVAAALMGLYYQWYKPIKVWLACIAGTLAVLAIYSLFPEQERFSRGVIIYGGLVAAISISILKWILRKLNIIDTAYESEKINTTIVVATANEYRNIVAIYTKANVATRLAGRIALNEQDAKEGDSIGTLNDWLSIVTTTHCKEIVICIGTISTQQALTLLPAMAKKVSVRFSFTNSSSVVGSKYKVTAGDAISVEGLYQLAHPYQMQMKRINDVVIVTFLYLTFPLQLLFASKALFMYTHAWSVLIGKKTWVGYTNNTVNKQLPTLLPPVIGCNGLPFAKTANNISLQQIVNTNYAVHYKWYNDWLIIAKYYLHKQ